LLNVKQFRYGGDNLGYLIYAQKDAVVIDGGAYREILDFMKIQKLNLLYVTNTHSHFDHTSGDIKLINSPRVRFLKYQDLMRDETIDLEDQKIDIYNTPGHTDDSVCFHVGNILISGDTLFNGTIGNCFTGDLREFYKSIRKLMSLPPETIIYAGHDYVQDAMLFAQRIEPDTADIEEYLSKYDHRQVYSTLQDEFRVNPYMRFNDEKIITLLRKRGLPVENEWERWQSLMTIE